MASRLTVEREIEGRTFIFKGDATPGRPSFNYYEPDDPPEVEIESVHEGDTELQWEDFEALLVELVGAENVRRELDAIDAAFFEALDDWHLDIADHEARMEAGL